MDDNAESVVSVAETSIETRQAAVAQHEDEPRYGFIRSGRT